MSWPWHSTVLAGPTKPSGWLPTPSRDPSHNGDASPLSIDLAVTALASQKLGRHAEALAACQRLRSLASARPDVQQAAGFLREVESVVHEIGTRNE